MKIAYLTNHYDPSENYAENNLPENYESLGHRVWIITNKTLLNEKSESSKIILLKNKLSFLKKTLSYRGKQEYKKLKEISPDIIIVSSEIDNLGLFAAIKYKKKNPKTVVCVCSHFVKEDLYSNSKLKKFQIYFFKWFYKFFQDKIDLFLSISPPTTDYLKSILKIKKPICFLPLGFDPEKCKFNSGSRKIIRKNLGLDSKNILMIHTGKYVKNKKELEIIQAFHKLLKTNKKVFLLFIGKDLNEDKKYETLLKNYVKENNLSKRVFFMDFMKHEELIKYFSAADLGIWPESPSISMVELMACKTTVLFQKDKIYNYIYKDSILRDYLFNTTTKEGIFEKVKKFSEGNIKELNNESFEKVKKYTWEDISRKAIKIFEKYRNLNNS